MLYDIKKERGAEIDEIFHIHVMNLFLTHMKMKIFRQKLSTIQLQNEKWKQFNHWKGDKIDSNILGIDDADDWRFLLRNSPMRKNNIPEWQEQEIDKIKFLISDPDRIAIIISIEYFFVGVVVRL